MSILPTHIAHLPAPVQAVLLQLLQSQEETNKPLTERPDFDFWPALINMIAVLVLVVGLIVLLGWLLRRFGGGRFGGFGDTGLMKLVSTLPLGDKRSLAVVRVGKKHFLIGIASGQINNLGELEREEVEQAMKSESVMAEPGGFAGIFRRIRGGKGEDA